MSTLSFRFVRHAMIALALLLALSVGALVPAVAAAAPPAQTPPTGANDLAQTVSAFLDLLIAFIVGGGIAYVLQMITAWTEWKSPFKPWVVVLLTALIGAALTSLKVLATAELFSQVPDWGRAFIGFIVVFVGSQITYQRGFNPAWATVTRVGVVIAVLLLGGALVLANAPVANAESPATDRLSQEPALFCVALEVGLPADAVALAKVKFDTRFGFAHNLATSDEWAATWGERMQYFTDWLGVPNPTIDGVLKPWCARLVAAQARILEP